MPHLVSPITARSVGEPARLTLAHCLHHLREAHDYLAQHGMAAARCVASVVDPTSWGTSAKRVPVEFPDGLRPALISKDLTRHSFAEVVNQCATIERLLNALTWAQSEASGLRTWTVEVCHPTTSSGDHDLVLHGPAGELAWFEVSDVASDRDGNGKETKDLIRLGVLVDGAGDARIPSTWPAARMFLVVSAELGRRLLKRLPQDFTYAERLSEGGSVIVEVIPTRATP